MLAQRNPFEHVPRDVWRHTVEFLPVHEIVLFRRVCKEAQVVGDIVLETGVEVLDLTSRRFLESSGTINEFGRMLIKRCQAVQAIRVAGAIEPLDLCSMNNNNRCLRVLAIRNSPAATTKMYCNQLIALSIHGFVGDNVWQLAASLPNLQALRLRERYLTFADASDVLRHAPQLRVLDADLVYLADEPLDTASLQHGSNLQCLGIVVEHDGSSEQVKEQLFALLRVFGAQLRSLSTFWHSPICSSGADFAQIAQCCPSLTQLFVNYGWLLAQDVPVLNLFSELELFVIRCYDGGEADSLAAELRTFCERRNTAKHKPLQAVVRCSGFIGPVAERFSFYETIRLARVAVDCKGLKSIL